MIERELGHPQFSFDVPAGSVLHENDGGGMKPAKRYCAAAARRPKAAISGVFNAQI
jgi:hypothetical protein